MIRSKLFYALVNTFLASSIFTPQILYLNNYSLAVAEPIQGQKTEINQSYSEGVSYYKRGLYAEALKSFQSALVIYQTKKDRYGEANVLNKIGRTYQQLGEFSKSIEFYKLALIIGLWTKLK